MPEWIVLLGALVGILGALAYVRDTLSGKTKPNRVSFVLWALAPFIAVAAQIYSGVTWAALPVFVSGFGPFLIFCASFANKKTYWKQTRFDWVCGLLSVLALALWQTTKNPDVAIFFALLADATAALPTLKKCWTHPETETVWAYLGGLFSASLGVLVAKDDSFAQIGFPLYLVSVCFLLVLFIQLGKWRKRNLLTLPFQKKAG